MIESMQKKKRVVSTPTKKGKGEEIEKEIFSVNNGEPFIGTFE
jgi:hypothetical protein